MKKIILIVICSILIIPGYAEKKLAPELLGRALIQVWEDGKVETLGKILSPDVVYEVSHSTHRYIGFKEAVSYISHLHAFSKDLKLEVLTSFSTKNENVIEWVMSGIQVKPIEGRISIATNRKFRIRGLTIIHVKDGLITKAVDYLDVLGFLLQLGAKVELPGGVVLEIK